MWPTAIDRDARRLLRATGLALTLYLALGALAVYAPPLPRKAGTRGADTYRNPPGGRDRTPLRLTLSRPDETRQAPDQRRTRPEAPPPHPAPEEGETRHATIPGQPIPEPQESRSSGSGQDSSGTYEPSAQDTANDEAFKHTPDAEAFSLWIDKSIRARLIYPERAKRRGLEGSVLIELRSSADGQTGSALLIRGSGHGLLDSAALDLAESLFPSPLAPGRPWVRQVEILYRLLSDTP